MFPILVNNFTVIFVVSALSSDNFFTLSEYTNSINTTLNFAGNWGPWTMTPCSATCGGTKQIKRLCKDGRYCAKDNGGQAKSEEKLEACNQNICNGMEF